MIPFMRPVSIQRIRLTKNVSSIRVSFQRPWQPQRSPFQNHNSLRFFATTGSKDHSDSKSNEHQERVVLKGDLGLWDPSRNTLYAVAAAGLVIAIAGGIYWFLNSTYFESNLRFDENDPAQWPKGFLQYAGLVAQIDRFSMNPKYLSILLRGIYHPDEEIREACFGGLSALATDRHLNAEIAKSVDMPKILHSLRGSQSVNLLISVMDLMESLSFRADNATILLNKQTLPVIELMCHHPKDEVKYRVSNVLRNVSKNGETTELLVRLIPPMYTLYRNTEESSRRGVTIALRNILNSKTAKEKYANIYKQSLTNAKIPEHELESIRSFEEESRPVYLMKGAAAALTLGAAYSGTRWAIHGSRKGLRQADLLALLARKTPMSALAAAGLFLYGNLDDYVFSHLVEPNLNSEAATLGTLATSGALMVGVLWASQAVAPFSLVPAAIYPLYKNWKEGSEPTAFVEK